MDVGTFDVKSVFKRIRFSRKFVLISGGVLLLGGASGVAAIFVGKEALFGTAQVSVNGLECSMVQTVNIKKNGAVWIRKFIRTDGGDGTDRIKTALRVAKSAYDETKPDLVQVSVLDQKGPTMRSDMRGRAVAAQVVYIPDVTKLPSDAQAKPYSAFYYDGAPNDEGVFYGLKIDLPLEDTERLAASLTEFTPCSDPAAEHAPADAHGAAASGHEKSGDAKGGGHGEAAPADDGHGAKEPEGAHGGGHEGEPTAKDGHGSDDPALLTSTPEPEPVSMFSLAYVKSLIFGKGPVEAVAAESGHGEQPVPDEPKAHESGAHEPAAHEAPASAKPEEPAKPEH